MLNSWLVTLWGAPLDPMLPFYALVGAGGLAGTVSYLRAVVPQAADHRPPRPRRLLAARGAATGAVVQGQQAADERREASC